MLSHPAALRIWNASYDDEGRWCPARAAAEATVMLKQDWGRKRKTTAEPESEPEPDYDPDSDASMD